MDIKNSKTLGKISPKNRMNREYVGEFKELFVDYCMTSSVHGVRYFGESKRAKVERVWWIIAFMFSLYGCGRLILNVYNKWEASPVIVSFGRKSTPVWEIPFPAVTICPETKASSTIVNFTSTFKLMMEQNEQISDDDVRRMRALLQVCDSSLSRDLNLAENFTDESIMNTLKEVALSIDLTMFKCKWRNDFANGCLDLFNNVMTDEGLCYTFNSFNAKELYTDQISDDFPSVLHNRTSVHWNPMKGYENIIPVDPEIHPYRVFGSGMRAGLVALIILYQQDFDYLCRKNMQGLKVLLHTPHEMPQMSKHYFRVPLDHEVVISVKPNMMITSKGLRDYEPKRRKCYFESEKNLRFFRIYTKMNCELECLSNFTLQTCGCVKFSMPRDNKTPICGISKIPCYNYAEDKLLETQFINGVSDKDLMGSCNCLPACTSFTYDAELSQAPFNLKKVFKAYRIELDEYEYSRMRPARVSVFFKENQFIASKRSVLFQLTDFLANCGGLLGLFMGFSLLSILELIYFFTLRLFCKLKKRGFFLK